MKKLLKRLVEKLVAWAHRKVYEDTISEKEAERIWSDIKKFVEDNKVK